MTPADFDVLLERRLTLTRDVLAGKAGEYASTRDLLHNFKHAAAITRQTPAEALLGMLTKHLVSIVDMVKSDVPRGRAAWDEKIGDAVNYLILLEALAAETLTIRESRP